QLVVNPWLFNQGLLPTYRRGANALWTKMATDLDFWMSVDIGLKISVALIGIWMAGGILLRYLRRGSGSESHEISRATPPPGRGDFNWQKGLILFFLCQAAWVLLGHTLVPGFPLAILIFLGFLYTPLISYVSARMFGLTGQGVGLPYLNEAINIRTG